MLRHLEVYLTLLLGFFKFKVEPLENMPTFLGSLVRMTINRINPDCYCAEQGTKVSMPIVTLFSIFCNLK